LWEMMNQLDVSLLAYLTSLLASNETFPHVERTHRKKTVLRENGHLKNMLTIIDQLENIFRRQRVVDCVEYCLTAKDLLSKPFVDLPGMSSSLTTLKTSILRSLQKKQFLQVGQDGFEFVEEDALLGYEVKTRFPAAARDVKAAADCFAAECFTAAVFHLLRAAEVGLRSLARDRRITLADKQSGEKDWTQILKKLEIVVFDLRVAPASKWGGAEDIKELQVAFYGELVQVLRSFDDAWKTHVSHGGSAVFYNRDQAAHILKHVRVLMQKLAARISETSVTEEFWNK